MNARIVVDPVTRIEGHLRIEAQMAIRSSRPIPRARWCAVSKLFCATGTLAARLGLRATHLRRVHPGTRHCIGPFRRKRNWRHGTADAQLIRNLMIGASTSTTT